MILQLQRKRELCLIVSCDKPPQPCAVRRTADVVIPLCRFAVQAIRGEFSPPEDHPDDERQEDLILQALTKFPATVQLKVVSRPLSDAELDG